MKTLMVGAGIISSIDGWALSGAGHAITHFVRPGKAERLAAGIPIDVLDSRAGHTRHFVGCYRLRVTKTLTPSDAFDLIIVPTKPYQLGVAMPVTQGFNNDIIRFAGATTGNNPAIETAG